jgi:formylglycine-generating enzyme required for sulfatase activity
MPSRSFGLRLSLVTFALLALALPFSGQPNQREFANSIGMRFVLIEPGEFVMGAGPGEPRRADEAPHLVRLTKAYYIGAHEVTVGQFKRFAEDEMRARKTADEKKGCCSDAERGRQRFERGSPGGYSITGAGHDEWIPSASWKNPGWEQTDQHPAVFLSWEDADRFVKWLSKKEGRKYRLPTEAEWEYACRARTSTAYWWGDYPNDESRGLENVADWSFRRYFPLLQYGWDFDDGYSHTSPVGTFRPNPFGLYDVAGNAVEWVADYYGDYYGNSRDINQVFVDPTGPGEGVDRVVRGGAWGVPFNQCRCAFRFRTLPNNRFSGTGFRVVMEP